MLENVVLGLRLAGLGWADATGRAHAALTRLGLSHRLGARPAALSSGEQQRAAVARATAFSPRLLLADEPTANLDWRAGRVALESIVEGALLGDAAVIVATHDERVLGFATRVLRLTDGALVEDRVLRPAA